MNALFPRFHSPTTRVLQLVLSLRRNPKLHYKYLSVQFPVKIYGCSAMALTTLFMFWKRSDMRFFIIARLIAGNGKTDFTPVFSTNTRYVEVCPSQKSERQDRQFGNIFNKNFFSPTLLSNGCVIFPGPAPARQGRENMFQNNKVRLLTSGKMFFFQLHQISNVAGAGSSVMSMFFFKYFEIFFPKEQWHNLQECKKCLNFKTFH